MTSCSKNIKVFEKNGTTKEEYDKKTITDGGGKIYHNQSRVTVLKNSSF